MNYYYPGHQTEQVSLFNKACKYHERGLHPEAEKLYRHLLADSSGNWFLHYNLGLLLFETDRPQEALVHYLTAASLTDESADLYYNLALCHKQCGHYRQAVDAYLKALAINPEDTDSRYNLAGCYIALQEWEKAISCYETVLEKVEHHQSAWNNLAYILQKTGRIEMAVRCYKRLLKINPEHRSADHMLAALTGISRSTAPPSYIKELFDNYSERYEDSLVNRLHYGLPKQLVQMITAASGKEVFEKVLDIGCGTGLIGEKIRNSAALLHGVDISPNMIEIARRKGLYDVLVTGDIHAVLKDFEYESYDLIIAADVFAYIGDIREVLRASRRVGSENCHFYYSVEDLDQQTAEMVLQDSGRFAHSENYISQAAETTGWQIFDVQKINLRTEKDRWVRGAVYAMEKQAIREGSISAQASI